MASLEDTNSTKKVEEDRSAAIEAAIVRIMKVPYPSISSPCLKYMQSLISQPNLTLTYPDPKARKTLTHQQLLAEVLAQLSFFSPNAKVVYVCMYVYMKVAGTCIVI